MAKNFTANIEIDGQTLLMIAIPQMRKNGMHYEVNIKNIPRFYVNWSPLGRYDISEGQDVKIDDKIVLAVSDAIEAMG